MNERNGALSIGDVAEATGLSAHTLRYYEDEGLIRGVVRNGAGHRRYSPDHIRSIGLLERLRMSGMSIARMRQYVELTVRGDATAADRKALLEEHEADLCRHIGELEQCLAIVRAKIDLYAGRLDDPSAVWSLLERARSNGRSPSVTGRRDGSNVR